MAWVGIGETRGQKAVSFQFPNQIDRAGKWLAQKSRRKRIHVRRLDRGDGRHALAEFLVRHLPDFADVHELLKLPPLLIGERRRRGNARDFAGMMPAVAEPD